MRPSVPLLLAWLLPAFLTALPAGGSAAADLYRVELIPVDATAENAVAARVAAIEQGQRDGLATLLRRLTPTSQAAGLPDPATVDLDRAVRSYDVADEQVASTRYLARINVNYNPAEIGRLLAGSGVAYVQRPPDPVLVLPALRTAEGWSLWGESPWRSAWYARAGAPAPGLLDLVLPLGDASDISGFSQEALEAADSTALADLAQRYEAGSAYVVAASVPPGEAIEGAPVQIEVLGPQLGEPLATQTVTAGPGADPAASLAPAVEAAVAALEAAWKEQNLGGGGSRSRLLVEVPLADLRGWVHIRRELETLPLVRSVRIDSLERTRASLSIDYLGGLPQLESAVARRGMTLTQENDRWRLLPAGGPAGIEAPPL
jgi:hypothetical protein